VKVVFWDISREQHKVLVRQARSELSSVTFEALTALSSSRCIQRSVFTAPVEACITPYTNSPYTYPYPYVNANRIRQ
jgi:hypothetical protein